MLSLRPPVLKQQQFLTYMDVFVGNWQHTLSFPTCTSPKTVLPCDTLASLRHSASSGLHDGSSSSSSKHGSSSDSIITLSSAASRKINENFSITFCSFREGRRLTSQEPKSFNKYANTSFGQNIGIEYERNYCFSLLDNATSPYTTYLSVQLYALFKSTGYKVPHALYK